MEEIAPSIQLNLLLIGAFLIGVLMTWLYWRRKQERAISHAIFDREREVEKLQSEMDLLEVEGVKVSPSEYLRSKKSQLFRKDEKIAQLQHELDHLQIEGQKVSASYYVIKMQKELEQRDQQIAELKKELSRVEDVGLASMSKGEKEFSKAKQAYQQEIEEKEEENQALRKELKAALTSLETASPPSLTWEEKEVSPETIERKSKQKLIEKDEEISRLTAALDSLTMNNEDGTLLKPEEAFQRLKDQLARRNAEIARLQTEFDLLVDAEGMPEGEKLSPKEAFNRLRARLMDKEAELSALRQKIENPQVQVSPSEAFAAMQRASHAEGEEQQTIKPVGQDRELGQLTEEISQLRQKLEEKERKIKELQATAKRPQDELPETEIQRIAYVARLESRLQHKENEVSDLRAQLGRYHLEGQDLEMPPTQLIESQQSTIDTYAREIEGLKEKLAAYQAQENSLPPDYQEEMERKDARIATLQEEIEKLKTPPAPLSPPEEVYPEHENDLDEQKDWFAIQKEYELDPSDSAQKENLEKEVELLRQGFAEIGKNFTGGLKEFLPASVYEKLIDLDNEGISISDQDGYFLVFNPRLRELIGYSREEANDESESTFLERLYPDPNYRAIVGRNIASIPEDGTFHNNRAVVTTKSGLMQELEVSSTSFFYQGKKYYLSYYTEAMP